MASEVIMPKLSPTMEEGQLSRWLKKEGDKVSMGEPLAEIDTDKATMEMQALGSGVLRKILIKEGESAPLGQLIAIISTPDEDISALLDQAPEQSTQTTRPAEPKAEAAATPPPGQPAGDNADRGADRNADGNGRRAAPVIKNSPSGRLIVSPLAA